MDWRARVEADPKVMVGKPVVKGTRLTVEFIVEPLANGWSFEDLLREYPGLVEEDITACLYYAHDVLKDVREFPLKT